MRDERLVGTLTAEDRAYKRLRWWQKVYLGLTGADGYIEFNRQVRLREAVKERDALRAALVAARAETAGVRKALERAESFRASTLSQLISLNFICSSPQIAKFQPLIMETSGILIQTAHTLDLKPNIGVQ